MKSLGVGTDVHISNQVLQDFAEGQRHNGQIVAPKTEHRNPDQKAKKSGQNAAHDHSRNQAKRSIGNGGLKQRRRNNP